jgi:hypothetical protein
MPLTDGHQVALADFGDDEIVFSIPRTAVLNTQNTPSEFATVLTPKYNDQIPNWLVGSPSFRKVNILGF